MTLVKNAGSLLKEKMRRLGQSNIPETEQTADRTERLAASLGRTASTSSLLPGCLLHESKSQESLVEGMIQPSGNDTMANTVNPQEKSEEKDRKAKFLLGKSYSQKK